MVYNSRYTSKEDKDISNVEISLILYPKSYVPRYTKILPLFIVSIVCCHLFSFSLFSITHSH